MMDAFPGELEDRALDIRRDVLRLLSLSQGGGLLESFALVEILVYLYEEVLRTNPSSPLDPSQDRFLLGCAHASPVHYAVLAHEGFFPREDLWSYGKLGAMLQGSPDIRRTPGIRYPVSSPGHILGIAAGMALGLRAFREDSSESPRMVACLDIRELQEGVAWEALRIAREFSLENLLVVVNCAERGEGELPSIWLDVGRIRSRMNLLGWETLEEDGHDYASLRKAFEYFQNSPEIPGCIFFHTRLGRGIPSLEESGESPDFSDRSWLAGALHELENFYRKLRREASE